MFHEIYYCVGNKTIEINGETFDLGVLSTEALNIPVETYRQMRSLLTKAESLSKGMDRAIDIENWKRVNEIYLELDALMMQHRLFRLIKQDAALLPAAKTYLERGGQVEEKEDVETVFEWPGSLEEHWRFYQKYCEGYAVALLDLQSFHDTIVNFIKYFLSGLSKMNRNNYAAALCDFLNDPNADRLIANPLRHSGYYMTSDAVRIEYVPRETEEDSGEFQIYEYYEAQMLQTLLKTDFYKGLEAGHVIRKCEFCGRYFLLRKGYHTKYCDQPNPDQPEFTCAQLGYHYNGIKEAVQDNPKAQSLRRCLGRIEKDYSRGIISEEEKERLSDKARDLFHAARTKPGITNEEFEASLQSKNLYPLCNVQRVTKPRGRPKKGGADHDQ